MYLFTGHFTYGADGIVNIVENANKFEDWMVI